MSDLLYRCQHVVRTKSMSSATRCTATASTMLSGAASFVDAHDPRDAAADDADAKSGRHILIASARSRPGPRSAVRTGKKSSTATNFSACKNCPRVMIIVGGGVIGTEYACMLAAVGVKVTLVESRPRLLEFVDDEIAESLQFRLRDMGIRLRLGESVSQDHPGCDGQLSKRCWPATKALAGRSLLYCIGRQGATDD